MSDDLSSAELLDALSRHRESYRQRFADIQCLGFADVIARSKIGRPRLLKDIESKEREQRSASAGSGDPRNPEQRQKPVEPTLDEQLLTDLLTRKRTRLFITGEGGIGKTEFTRHLAYHLADKLAPTAAQPLIPIRIELNGIEPTGPTFLSRLAGLSPPIELALLEGMTRAGRIAFILDGLDELNPAYTRKPFDEHLKDFIEKYKTCTFILAGRPGILNTLGTCFPASAQFEIEPLKNDEIQRYITDYFTAVGDSARGAELAAAVKRSGAVMRPVLTQPFLLALTCILYHGKSGDVALPNDPATLLEKGLKKLFERRKSQADHDSAIPLKLPSATCLDALGVLFAHSVEKQYAPSSDEATAALVRHMKISYGDAESWLAQLAPACGVLVKTVSGYRHTNRVIAEYLAARWIATHGWSGPGRGPIAVAPGDDVQATLRKCYNHYVWSNDHRNLLRWLGFVLATSAQGAGTLMRLIHWLAAHLQAPSTDTRENSSGNASTSWRDDQYRSLLHRYLDLLSAIRPGTDACTHRSIDQAKTAFLEIVPPAGDWYYSPVVESVTGLPAEWIVKHGHALREKLRDEKHAGTVAYIAEALSSGWPEHKADACHALREQLRTEEDGSSIAVLAQALASGWPEHKADTGHALWKKLRDEKNEYAVGRLAQALASGWPEHKADAGDALRKKLHDKMHWYALARFVQVLASGWPGDNDTGDSLREKLRDEKDGVAVACLAEALASGWPEHKADAGHALREKLREEKHWYAVARLAQALALGWPGDKDAGHALREKLRDEKDGVAVAYLAQALASGWLEHKADACQALREKLRAEVDGVAVARLAQALASGWPEHKAEAGDALREKLRDEEDWEAADQLAQALASGWPGDVEDLRLIRRKAPDTLRNVWPDWVILFGPLGNAERQTGLAGWADRCGWSPAPDSLGASFHCEPLDPPAIKHNPDTMSKDTTPGSTPGTAPGDAVPAPRLGFILAPREKLRPGLDPLLDPVQPVPAEVANGKPARKGRKGQIQTTWPNWVPKIKSYIEKHLDSRISDRSLRDLFGGSPKTIKLARDEAARQIGERANHWRSSVRPGKGKREHFEKGIADAAWAAYREKLRDLPDAKASACKRLIESGWIEKQSAERREKFWQWIEETPDDNVDAVIEEYLRKPNDPGTSPKKRKRKE